MFKQCDLDGDGKIDYHEFLVASFNHKAVLTEDNLQKAFNLFDVNKDQQISVEELKVVLPTRNIQNVDGTSDDAEVIAQENERWNSIVGGIDENNDG